MLREVFGSFRSEICTEQGVTERVATDLIGTSSI